MDFVRSPMGNKTLWKGMKAKSVLGGPAFVSRIRRMLEDGRELHVSQRFQRHIDKPGLEDLRKDAAFQIRKDETGLSWLQWLQWMRTVIRKAALRAFWA